MKIVICDDNEKEQQSCRKQLEELSKKHQVKAEFISYKSGEEFLFHLHDAKNYPDIIYLDMKMDKISGAEVAERLRKQNCRSEVVYFTVSKEYYDSAFDVEALHYIVKGEITKEKFESIFLRAVERVSEKERKYILFSGAGEYRNIEIGEIRYFQVLKRIITVFYGDDESFEFYSSIGKIENQLREHGFIRAHRSYLVSAGHIRAITYNEVTMDNGASVPVGRSCYATLKQSMLEYGK